MNNVTHEDLGDMLFREMQSANNLIGTLECTGFMSMERWNFMLKYIYFYGGKNDKKNK